MNNRNERVENHLEAELRGTLFTPEWGDKLYIGKELHYWNGEKWEYWKRLRDSLSKNCNLKGY